MGAEDPEPVESIDPDDYVLVQFAGRRSHRYYVGESGKCWLPLNRHFVHEKSKGMQGRQLRIHFSWEGRQVHTHAGRCCLETTSSNEWEDRKNGQAVPFRRQQAETLCPSMSIAQLQRERCINWLCLPHSGFSASLGLLTAQFVTLGLIDQGCICHFVLVWLLSPHVVTFTLSLDKKSQFLKSYLLHTFYQTIGIVCWKWGVWLSVHACRQFAFIAFSLK